MLIVFVGLGVYLTAVAYTTDHLKASQKLIDHVKTLKWLGPTSIVVGFLGSCIVLMELFKGHTNNEQQNSGSKATSNFGFRFY